MNIRPASGEIKFQFGGYLKVTEPIPRVFFNPGLSHIRSVLWLVYHIDGSKYWLLGIRETCTSMGNSPPLYPFPSCETTSSLAFWNYYLLTIGNVVTMKFVFSICKSILGKCGQEQSARQTQGQKSFGCMSSCSSCLCPVLQREIEYYSCENMESVAKQINKVQLPACYLCDLGKVASPICAKLSFIL